MESFVAVIDRWPSPRDLDQEIRARPGTSALWKHRGWIPPEWWPAVLGASADRGFDDITADLLAEISAKVRPPPQRAARDLDQPGAAA